MQHILFPNIAFNLILYFLYYSRWLSNNVQLCIPYQWNIMWLDSLEGIFHLHPIYQLLTMYTFASDWKCHINLKSTYQKLSGMWSTKFIELDAGVWKIPFHKIHHILIYKCMYTCKLCLRDTSVFQSFCSLITSHRDR